MNNESLADAKWPLKVPAQLITLVALVVIVLAPFFALQWYRQPFLGVLLEHTFVVAQIYEDDWPATKLGVRFPDRLVAANGTLVEETKALINIVNSNDAKEISLTFERQEDRSRYTISIEPRAPYLEELVKYFVMPYLTGLVFLVTGLWVVRLAPNNSSGYSFLILTSATSIATASIFDMSTTHVLTLAWVVSMPMVGGALGHMALVFPQWLRGIYRFPVLRFVPWIIAFSLAIPTAIQFIYPADPWEYIPVWLRNYVFLSAASVLFVTVFSVRAIAGILPLVRQQSRIIVFGMILAFGPLFFLFFLPVVFGQIPEFPSTILISFLIIFPISVAYGIVRYRLLDIDRILSNSLTYGLTMGGAITIFYLLLIVLSFIFQETVDANDPLVMAFFLLLLVLFMNPLRHLIQKGINRVFYRSQVDFRGVLSNLSHRLVLTPDLDRMLNLLDDVVKTMFSPERFVLYLYNDSKNLYVPYSNQTITDGEISPQNGIIQYLEKTADAVWFAPDMPYPEDLAEEAPLLDELNYQMLVPLIYETRIIGIIALGPRLSGEPYTSEGVDFLRGVAGQSSLMVENARLYQVALEMGRIERELEMASLVQTSLLPEKVPKMDGWEFAAKWEPARETSGDYYDFIPLPDGHLGLLIADVTDKGMPAALFMAFSRSIIRATLPLASTPAEGITKANHMICGESAINMPLTAFFCKLQADSGEVIYVNAGHNPPLFYSAKEEKLILLSRTGMLLGALETAEYKQEAVELSPGDFILFYTDGVTDAINDKEEDFGEERLQKIVLKNKAASASEIVNRVKQEVTRFIGDTAPFDDITLMVAKKH